VYCLIGYGAIGREAKRIPLPDLDDVVLIRWYRTTTEYDKFPVIGGKFDLIYKEFGISLDRLIFDWFIEWR
jgi:hypothetical protein